MNYHSYDFTEGYAEALKSNRKSAEQGLAYAQEQINLIESRTRDKWIDQCFLMKLRRSHKRKQGSSLSNTTIGRLRKGRWTG
jgi:hypothetical protein